MDIGLLILRIAPGTFVGAHGLQKMTHLWGGDGIAGSAREFQADGPGRYSVDELIGLNGQWASVSAAATVAGIGAALLLRASLHQNTHPVGRPA